MGKIFILATFFLMAIPFTAQAKYPLPEYEFIVVESLPESINLNMSLRQIEDAKHTSQLQKAKNLIYELLAKKISPLLNNETFANNYNLFKLAQSIPVAEIVNDLIDQQKTDSRINKPAMQFMAMILPKIPGGSEVNKKLPFINFYSQNKASVIDDDNTGFKAQKSFSDLINERILRAIQFTFANNYSDPSINEAFFVGALLLINLDGDNTSIKFQIMGGLPTDKEYEVNLVQPEANFKYFRLPQKPQTGWLSDFYNDFPGVILTLKYQKTEAVPNLLKIQFGSLSLIDKNEIIAEKKLQAYEEIKIGWKDYAGILFKEYNVPNLFGSDFAPIGKILINKTTRDIKVNIHELEFDLNKLEVIRMRVVVEFPSKKLWGGWNITHNFMPAIEQPALNEKFKNAINDQIEPYRYKLNLLKNEYSENGLVGLISHSEVNDSLMQIIETILGNQSRGSH
jgi:hypothetical protein